MSNRTMQISLALVAAAIVAPSTVAQQMDKMWCDREVQAGVESSERAALFRDGNYGMFIHWGLYSHLGGKWKGETFYGIGEWIKRQMEIPDDLQWTRTADGLTVTLSNEKPCEHAVVFRIATQ